MNVCVIGTGYVGLVTGTCLAETGNQVICVDIDKQKVENMKQGIVPIYEPQLDVFFERNLKQGRLHFTTDLAEGVQHADILFLALPTPPGEDGSADLSYVLGVARQLGPMLKSYKIIIDKSTVPVGTADLVRAEIQQHAKVEFDVVSNPEFLREGFAVEDFMKPDRIVIGTESPKAREILNDLYAPYVRQGNPIYFMDERSAEMTKYAANSFLATKISFMNEIARLCERVGANVDQVRLGIGSDERIGKRFLFPGLGYGGSCFPKDVQALVHTANQNEYDFKILQAVMDVNQSQKSFFVQKILHHFQGDLKGKKIALWGLAFKPDTDDIREAPALDVIEALNSAGAQIVAFDPEAMENVRQVLGDAIGFANSAYETLDGADALVIATEWGVFRNPNMDEIKTRIKTPLVFDGRNIFQPSKMKSLGFQYISIGR
ncbi:MAG: UDP-glucose/GDP-mannose dehydrogenase family protein [Bacteroidetes bacterium]|nr:UDP-glucose/GDP-mannose dehydrogenase family protein [Bacteroidota bacterium]